MSSDDLHDLLSSLQDRSTRFGDRVAEAELQVWSTLLDHEQAQQELRFPDVVAHVADVPVEIRYGRLSITRTQRVIRSGDGSRRTPKDHR